MKSAPQRNTQGLMVPVPAHPCTAARNPKNDNLVYGTLCSFHEIGTIDIAAIIDYVLLETNAQRIFYIGHNQGMTALFTLLSAKPRYNRKLHHAVGLASIAYLGTTDNRVLRRAAELTDRIYATLRSLNVHEIKPTPDIIRLLSGAVCSGETNDMCAVALRGLLGTTVDRSRALLPVIVDDLWCSISTRQLIHFGQLMQTSRRCWLVALVAVSFVDVLAAMFVFLFQGNSSNSTTGTICSIRRSTGKRSRQNTICPA